MMSDTKIALLQCRSGAQFHFGEIAHDVNMALDQSSKFMHSDTLFSAFVNEYDKIWREDEHDTNQFVAEIKGGNIKFSSVFYCLEKNSNYIWFVPRPAHTTLLVDADFKKYKAVQFVSLGILQNKILPIDWFNKGKCIALQNGTFICTLNEFLDIYPLLEPDEIEDLNKMCLFTIQDETKVKIHTTELENRLYNQSNLMICNNSYGINVHLWFAYNLADDKSWYNERFVKLSKLFKYNGIGGQRSTGCGALENVTTGIVFPYKLSNSKYSVSLSLLAPDSANEFSKCLFYNPIIRGGRVIRQFEIENNDKSENVTISLNRLRMLAEGAILSDKVKGKIADITPVENGYFDIEKDSYLRNGIAFSIPISEKFVPEELLQLVSTQSEEKVNDIQQEKVEEKPENQNIEPIIKKAEESIKIVDKKEENSDLQEQTKDSLLSSLIQKIKNIFK